MTSPPPLQLDHTKKLSSPSPLLKPLQLDDTNKLSSRTSSTHDTATPINCRKPQKELPEISHDNYANNIIELKWYIIPKLKAAAKLYKLRSSGKKQEIIDRLSEFFLQTKSSITIQRYFRSWICRYIIRLRGNALTNKKMCVNDTDFCTMEPLHEIENDYFYSFTDDNKFTYGFNITSLIEMLKRNNKSNPYTRETWSDTRIKEITTLYNLSFILCTGFSKINIPYAPKVSTTTIRRRQANRSDYSPIIRPITRAEDLERYNNIRNIRNNTIDNRINELFIEIDLLGNYTSREWFDNLEVRDYIRLYRKLYEIWYYRGELSREVQNNICPFYSPFDGIFTRPLLHNEINLQQIKTACLIVIENMTYSGVTEDYRKIGILHALSALTSVSSGARMALPWLYESIQG